MLPMTMMMARILVMTMIVEWKRKCGLVEYFDKNPFFQKLEFNLIIFFHFSTVKKSSIRALTASGASCWTQWLTYGDDVMMIFNDMTMTRNPVSDDNHCKTKIMVKVFSPRVRALAWSLWQIWPSLELISPSGICQGCQRSTGSASGGWDREMEFYLHCIGSGWIPIYI